MLYRKGWMTLIVLVSTAGLLVQPASAESYELTPSPSRTQESNAPGVSLPLSVSGASAPSYSFTWFVQDPAGNNKTASQGVVAPPPSFVVSVDYPSDFGGGASIRYVGTYLVAVLQTSPSFEWVALGQFEAGLTDKTSYQRTFPVSIKATNYDPGDDVTIDIRLDGVSAQGFPRRVLADSGGNVVDTWLTEPSTTTGSYTVTLTGTTTQPKSPADTQNFIVYPTNVTITSILMPGSSLQKTETAAFTFTANYLNGDPVQTGSGVVRIAEPDQQTVHFAVANWKSSQFETSYRIPLNSQTGIWVATIDVNNFDDGFGNGGPTVSPVKGFVVTPATLTVSLNAINGTRTVGGIVLISTAITSPDGSSFYDGTVNAQFFVAGRPFGSQIPLSYDTSQARWIGSYIIRENDESGAWLVQVSASDSYGNSGQGSTSILVSVPPSQQNSVTSWWFLSLIGVLVAGIALGLFFFKKKRILRRELQVDLQAVGKEADRVKNQEFFRSVQRQLGRMRDESKEKNDG